jgi:CubicO group peptidase (beta-lactamase class C family)
MRAAFRCNLMTSMILGKTLESSVSRNASDLSRRRLLMAACAGLGVATARASIGARPGCRKQDGPWIPSEEFLENELPLFMQFANVPGVSIAVIEDGTVAWTRAIGLGNVETKETVRTDTRFEAASMSKPAFVYVVMKLVEEGLLELDRPLSKYMPLPSFLAADDPRLDKVTVRDAMRHSTGLPNWVTDPDKETGRVPPARTVFAPGIRVDYSGTGMFWLQLVAESVSGLALGTMMQSRLLDPAGISSASYGWSEERARTCAYGHKVEFDPEAARWVAKLDPDQNMRFRGNPLLPIAKRVGKPTSDWKYADMLRFAAEAHPFDPLARIPLFLFPNAAYSLTATPTDYAKVLILMMDGRTRASWEISEQSRREMLTTQMIYRKELLGFGLGWHVDKNIRGGMLFGHGGDNVSMQCNSLADAQRRRGIVVMTNGADGVKVHAPILRAATGMDPFTLYV